MRKLLLILTIAVISYGNNGWTKLHDAIFKQDIKEVKKLVNTIDVDSESAAGATPLHLAVKMRNIEIINILLKKEADIDAQDNKGFSPLYYAVSMGNLKLTKHLLRNGADVNLANNIGNTPLHQVAFRNKFHLLDTLFKFGANPNARNKYGMLPYQFAQRNGHDVMVMELKNMSKLMKMEEE